MLSAIRQSTFWRKHGDAVLTALVLLAIGAVVLFVSWCDISWVSR